LARWIGPGNSDSGGIAATVREALQLREAPPPNTLVLVRFGRTTLADEKLRQTCEVTFARWGLYGFSVFELPGGSYENLGRLVPLLFERRWVLEAAGSQLLEDGFPLLPTRDHPHWTVVLSDPTPAHFARVRRHFSEPTLNPIWAGPRQR
jgi:hypothetical protein